MSNGGLGGGGQILIGPRKMPEVIKKLMIALVAAFFVGVLLDIGPLAGLFPDGRLELLAGLSGEGVFGRGWVWQPITSIFLHDFEHIGHLLGNLFFLWMFGSPVAEEIGTRRFTWLFVGGGVAASLIKLAGVGLFHLAGWEWSMLPWAVPSIGASGAVFVVVAWYCYRWPDRTISLLFLPISFTGRQAIPLWFLMEFGTSSGQIDHVVHVGGAVVGLLALKLYTGAEGGSGGWWPPRRKRPGHLKSVPGGGDGPFFH